MKRFCFFTFVVALSVYSITANAVQFQQSTPDASSNVETTPQQALLDARNDAETFTKGGNWFAAGFFCGVFGLIYAAVDTPSPPTYRLMGKSAEYIQIYTMEFQAKTRNKRLTHSGQGWGVGVLLGLALTILLSE